jgi:outer membrane protein TolC
LLVLLLPLALPGASRAVPEEAVPGPPRFQPRVEDRLLAPVPRPGREVSTWAEALALLRAASTDERLAAGAVVRAEGRARQALGVLMPNVRASALAGYDLLHPAGGASAPPVVDGRKPTVPLGVASLELTQRVVDVGAWRGLGAARSAQRSAEASLQNLRRQLTGGLARSLVAVVAAERVSELNRQGLAQALERAALGERTLELGAASHLDVVRVRQDVELARGTLIAGDEQLRRTRESLGLLLGGEEMGVKPGFALQGLVDETLADCAPVAAAQRADIEAARENLESARKSREQASAGYFPVLGVTSGLSAYTTEPGPGRFGAWNIEAVLSVPLWEGGARSGLVRERRGVEAQAAGALEQATRSVSIEAAQARRGVAVAESLAKAARASRDLAAQLDALTRRSFEVGRGTSLELVQSAQALRQADVSLATREFELVGARLDAALTEARCNW